MESTVELLLWLIAAVLILLHAVSPGLRSQKIHLAWLGAFFIALAVILGLL